MDVKKATKEQLINYIETLEATVKNDEHLASAVEAKDAEIYRLNNVLQDRKKDDGTQKQIEDLNKKHEDEMESIKQAYQKLAERFNKFIALFESTLKSVQGTVEIAVEAESLELEKLK